MRRFFLVGLVVLSGCGARFEAAQACRAEIGPEPNAGLNLFGAIGAAVMTSTDEHRAWQVRFDACRKRRLGNE